MLSIDMGGTKTAILFENKNEKKVFENALKKEYGHINERKCISYNEIGLKADFLKISKSSCISIYSTNDILNDGDFFKILEKINEEIPVLISYPHVVCRIKPKDEYYIENFSKFSKPFRMNVKLSLMVNDLTAFTFFYAHQFFEKLKRERKLESELDKLPNPVLCVQVGTGLNAFGITYSEFENGSFMDKIVEAGHLTFKFDGDLCSCGRKGCAEHYLAGCGIEERYGKEAREVLSNLKYKTKHEKMLALYLSSLVLIFDPIKMVVGGSIMKSVDKEKVREQTYDFLNAYRDYANVFRMKRKQILSLIDLNDLESLKFPLPIEYEESFLPNIFGVYLCYKKYFGK